MMILKIFKNPLTGVFIYVILILDISSIDISTLVVEIKKSKE